LTKKTYVSDFDNERRVAFLRSRAQATFRGEDWTLTWEDFQAFWSTRTLWEQRGRHHEDLVLTRYDWEGAWSKDNCCIISRLDHLRANGSNRTGKDIYKIIEGAKKYESL
jgi:hypothetical protein